MEFVGGMDEVGGGGRRCLVPCSSLTIASAKVRDRDC